MLNAISFVLLYFCAQHSPLTAEGLILFCLIGFPIMVELATAPTCYCIYSIQVV